MLAAPTAKKAVQDPDSRELDREDFARLLVTFSAGPMSRAPTIRHGRCSDDRRVPAYFWNEDSGLVYSPTEDERASPPLRTDQATRK